MKRFLLLSAFAIATSIAQASYLYWQVDSADANKYNANKAAFYVMNGDELVARFGTATFDTPTAIDLDSYGSTYSYYVELVNWDGANAVTTAREEVAYTDIQGSLVTSSLLEATQAPVWHSGTSGGYSPVPEPTSGLLMIVGMALLGLKRRKA